MGGSSSRLGSRPSRPRVNRFNIISSLVCGGSTSRDFSEMEDHPGKLLLDSIEATEDSSLTSCIEARIAFSNSETGTSSDCSTDFGENTSIEDESRNFARNHLEKCLSESKELYPACQVSVGHSHDQCYTYCSTSASTSLVEQQSSNNVSVNISANKDVVNGIDDSVDKDAPRILPEAMHASSSSPQGFGDPIDGEISVGNQIDEVMMVQSSDPNSVNQVSNFSLTPQLLRDESFQERMTSGLGFLMSNREQGHGDGGVLHLDVVTISSNIFSSRNVDASAQDTRRNGRRLFWDAFSRRSSRSYDDSSTVDFSMRDSDDMGTLDRWLLDMGGNNFNDGIRGNSAYLGSRFHRLNENQRRHSRSEVWERLRNGLDEIGRWTSLCPSGIHPDGMCSCESFPVTEESSAHASISRIVMLAEALFEVLDEIHRQPMSLSLSVVCPAPESIVDSFPLKSHKKVDSSDGGNDVEQCYICLAEYEEGEQIRTLPCHHEYHMSCVDRWLKEIHRVCPLCRGDVCGSIIDSAASNSEVPSH